MIIIIFFFAWACARMHALQEKNKRHKPGLNHYVL